MLWLVRARPRTPLIFSVSYQCFAMPKDSYNVSYTPIHPAGDASFGLCLCTMLIVTALLGCGVVVMWKTSSFNQEPQSKTTSGSSGMFERLLMSSDESSSTTSISPEIPTTKNKLSTKTTPVNVSVEITTNQRIQTKSIENRPPEPSKTKKVPTKNVLRKSNVSQKPTIQLLPKIIPEEITTAQSTLSKSTTVKSELSNVQRGTIISNRNSSLENILAGLSTTQSILIESTPENVPTIETTKDNTPSEVTTYMTPEVLKPNPIFNESLPFESTTESIKEEITLPKIIFSTSEKVFPMEQVDETTTFTEPTTSPEALTPSFLQIKNFSSEMFTVKPDIKPVTTTTIPETTTILKEIQETSSEATTSEKTTPQAVSSSTEGPKTISVSQSSMSSTIKSTSTSTTAPTKCEMPPIEDRNICKSSQCYATAGRMLSLINVTVDPCEDFYQYACGGIDSPTLLENDRSADVWLRMERAIKNISAMSPIYHQKFKTYYEGCVDYENLVPMDARKKQGREVLESISTFLRLGDDDLATDTISDLLIKLFQHGCAPLFDIQLDVDSTNSSKFQVIVTPSPMLFSGSHFLSTEEKNERCRHKAGDHIDLDTNKVYEKYLDCLDNVSGFLNTTREALHFFGLFDDMSETDSAKLIQDISMSIELEIFNLKKGFTAEEYINATQFKDTKHTTKKILGDQTALDYISEVNWDNLFLSLLKINVSEDVRVQVYFHEKIQHMFIGLDIPSRQRQMHNALLAVFAHDLYQELVLRHHSCDRERYCLRVAASLMPAVAANLYIATFPIPVIRKLRSQVLLVYTNLLTAIKENLEHAEWMDDTTHWDVKKKVISMSVRWPEMFNEAQITRNLEKCPLDKRDFLQDSICLVTLFQEQLYARFTMDPHAADAMWLHFSTPFSTETTFVHGLNTFMVPLAVMSPVYDPNMPYHVKAARLGHLLARGLGHCFDRTGVKFSDTGKLGNMLSEKSNPSYDQVVQDILFDELRPVFEGSQQYAYKPDPTLTLNSRLSDITAANLSLSIVSDADTTLPWVPFPSKQVYFIALAQEFCSKKKLPEMIPSMFEGHLLPAHRVENIVMNSEQFDKVFNCPEGSSMNKVHGTKIKPFPLYNEDGDMVPS